MSKQKSFSAGKRFLLFFFLIYVCLSGIPTAVYGIFSWKDPAIKGYTTQKENQLTKETSSHAESEPAKDFEPNQKFPEFLDKFSPVSQVQKENSPKTKGFTLYDAAEQKLITVSAREFLPSALACEMPLSAPREALKAQAVAIYTLACQKRDSEKKINGGDFACDSKNWLVYVPKEKMRERWGDDFESNYQLLTEITDEVSGQLLTENGHPILASYFAISCGATESSENVWGKPYSYLKSTASPGDALCDGYLSTTVLRPEQIKESLLNSFPDRNFSFSGPEETWFQNQKRTPAGYTKYIDVGGVTISGPELRSALSLRSACFDICWENGNFTFTVRGWGHGVGMSQAGAIFLAEQGADYRDILSWYYPGTELSCSEDK